MKESIRKQNSAKQQKPPDIGHLRGNQSKKVELVIEKTSQKAEFSKGEEQEIE